jgi:hypothetical protein
MRTSRSLAVVVAMLVATPLGGAAAQALAPGEVMVRGSPPVTFRVAVKVLNLMPDVTHVRVHCVLQQGATPIVHGETTAQVSSSGNFDGVVTVPVNILYPNQLEAKISQVTNYNCALHLVNNGNPPQVWAPDRANAPVWAQPKPGTTFVKTIGGKFPPKR